MPDELDPRRTRAARRSAERRPLRTDGLLATALDRIDAGDTWATPFLDGDVRDVGTWHRAAFRSAPPRWVRGLLAVRDALVAPLGLRVVTDGRPGFPVLASTADEVLVGLDDRHLSFRVSVRSGPTAVSVTTVVQIHNRLGHLYWTLVRHVHPWVVRASLRTVARPLGPSALTTDRVD